VSTIDALDEGNMLPAFAKDKVEPAFSAYKTILWGGGDATPAVVTGAGTYYLFGGPVSSANSVVVGAGGLAAFAFHLDPADVTASLRTNKLRLKVSCIVNAVAPATTLTVGLYPASTFGGGSGAQPTIASVGAVLAGSTVAFASPGASSVANQNSGDFNFPAAGHFVLMVAATGAMAANSQVQFMTQLQMRQV
jgi:hypothetical protein